MQRKYRKKRKLLSKHNAHHSIHRHRQLKIWYAIEIIVIIFLCCGILFVLQNSQRVNETPEKEVETSEAEKVETLEANGDIWIQHRKQ